MLPSKFYLFAIALAVATVLSPGCDKKSSTDKNRADKPTKQKVRKARTPPEFDWQDALEASPDATEKHAGPFEGDCNSQRPLPEPNPKGFGPFSDDDYCTLSAARDEARTSYRISRVLYAENKAVAVSLVPHQKFTLGRPPIEKLQLPTLAVRRDREMERDDTERRVVSFRRDTLDPNLEPSAPIAVDFIGEKGLKDEVARIDIYGYLDRNSLLDVLRIPQPPSASRELVVPTSLSPNSNFADVAITFGIDDIELRRWNDYTLRTPAGDTDVPPTKLKLDQESSDTGEAAWEDNLENFIANLQEHALPPESEGSNITFGIAATQTTPVGRVEEILLPLEQLLDPSYQLSSRRIPQFSAPFNRAARLQAVNFDLRTGPPEETTDRTGRTILNLSVHVTSEGFELETGRRQLPPIEGCPDPGPTICLAKPELQHRTLLEKAEKLQRKGELEASDERVAEVVWAFDWAALHRNVRRIQRQHEGANYIHISADPGIPVAVLNRVFDVTGFRFRGEHSESCDADFSSNEQLRESEPCSGTDGGLDRLFSRPVWRIR